MAVFFIMVILIGWGFSWYAGTSAILWGAVLLAVGMNLGAYWWSDVVAIKMTGAHPATRDSHRELFTVVENLSITAGLPMPKIYLVNDPAPNAFATGRSPERAVVAVTTGLLSAVNKTELEGVIAHELSHVGNRDMLVSTVAVVLVGFVAILADFFLRMTLWGGMSRDRDSRASVVFLLLGLVAAILAPIAAQLIHFAVSRKREFLADASGALLTRYPEGLASALEKISAYKGPMKRANHATAHLFIANPFGADGRGARWVYRLFSTHPAVEDRVKALRAS